LAKRAQVELQQGSLKVQAEQQKARLANPRKELDAETGRVREKAALRFDNRREPFSQSFKIASDRAKHGLEDRFDRWRGMHHMTLRATLVRDGEFHSSTGARYDLNQDIALLLLEAIPFAWDDFFGQHLKECLIEVQAQLQARSEVFLERLKNEATNSGMFDAARIASLASDIERISSFTLRKR
jgi:hypothetical protein